MFHCIEAALHHFVHPEVERVNATAKWDLDATASKVIVDAAAQAQMCMAGSHVNGDNVFRVALYADTNRGAPNFDEADDCESECILNERISDPYEVFNSFPFPEGRAQEWLYGRNTDTHEIWDFFEKECGVALAAFLLACFNWVCVGKQALRMEPLKEEMCVLRERAVWEGEDDLPIYLNFAHTVQAIKNGPDFDMSPLLTVVASNNIPKRTVLIEGPRRHLSVGSESRCELVAADPFVNMVKHGYLEKKDNPPPSRVRLDGGMNGPCFAVPDGFGSEVGSWKESAKCTITTGAEESNRNVASEAAEYSRLGRPANTRRVEQSKLFLGSLVLLLMVTPVGAYERTVAVPARWGEFAPSAVLKAPSLWDPRTWTTGTCGYTVINATGMTTDEIAAQGLYANGIQIHPRQLASFTPKSWMSMFVSGNSTKAFVDVNSNVRLFQGGRTNIILGWVNTTELCDAGIVMSYIVSSRTALLRMKRVIGHPETYENPAVMANIFRAATNTSRSDTAFVVESAERSFVYTHIRLPPIWVLVLTSMFAILLSASIFERFYQRRLRRERAEFLAEMQKRIDAKSVKEQHAPRIAKFARMRQALTGLAEASVNSYATLAIAACVGRFAANYYEGIVVVCLANFCILLGYAKCFFPMVRYLQYVAYIVCAFIYYRPTIDVSDGAAGVMLVLACALAIPLSFVAKFVPLPLTFIQKKFESGKKWLRYDSSGVSVGYGNNVNKEDGKYWAEDFIEEEYGSTFLKRFKSTLSAAGLSIHDLDDKVFEREEDIISRAGDQAAVTREFLNDIRVARTHRMTEHDYMSHIGDDRHFNRSYQSGVTGTLIKLKVGEAFTMEGVAQLPNGSPLKNFIMRRIGLKKISYNMITNAYNTRHCFWNPHRVNDSETFVRCKPVYCKNSPEDVKKTAAAEQAIFIASVVRQVLREDRAASRSDDEVIERVYNELSKVKTDIAKVKEMQSGNSAKAPVQSVTVVSPDHQAKFSDAADTQVAKPSALIAELKPKDATAAAADKKKHKKSFQSAIGGPMVAQEKVPLVFVNFSAGGHIDRQFTLTGVNNNGSGLVLQLVTIAHNESPDPALHFSPGTYKFKGSSSSTSPGVDFDLSVEGIGIVLVNDNPKVESALVVHGIVKSFRMNQMELNDLAAAAYFTGGVAEPSRFGVVGTKFDPAVKGASVRSFAVNVKNGHYYMAIGNGNGTIQDGVCRNSASTTSDFVKGEGSSGCPIFGVVKEGKKLMGVHSYFDGKNACVPFPDAPYLEKVMKGFCSAQC